MTTKPNFDRRTILRGMAASGALGIVSSLPFRHALAATTTIGFIYVGARDDYGYNQAHAEGAAALKKIPGVKIIECPSSYKLEQSAA
jgi:simple sugar transport system substrate-binding protein